jgi:hypothetical protein
MNDFRFYIINEKGEPVIATDLQRMLEWLDNPLRVVATDQIDEFTEVSTVFIGFVCDMGPRPEHYWETMIFGGPGDLSVWRCGGSREQALAQHAYVLSIVPQIIAKAN